MAVDPQDFRTETGRYPSPRLTSLMQDCACPACGHQVAVRLFDTRNQPLTTVCLPDSAAEAEQLPRLPLAFVRCVDCGHIYNSLFDYSQVPYARQPWLMFNNGATWARHLEQVRDVLLQAITPGCTVVEIGCAEGQLLRLLAAARPEARYVGFDPGSPSPGIHGSVELRRSLFDPARDLGDLRPTVMICRHVLEHLQSPAGFLQQLAFAVSWEDLDTR
ncbi:MAG: methyltransferase domain-containing protein, partial [Planctomycetaceae bacterium]|nr:methyltransferase domain-containing protein [Planctomycetaceae bacterium]